MECNAIQATSMKDVVRMATLLRDQGDRLLNSSFKLTLTVDFLVKLNEAFDLIVENVDTSCFQVISTNNSCVEFLHDLQFLHDFVQKISGLRLWNKNKILVSSVRLEKFRSLHYLDLHGVPVRNIKVSCVRDKLKTLNCTHCNLRDVKDLLSPGDDNASQNQEDGHVNFEQNWVFLEEIFLPFNSLEVLGSALLYVPRLKLMDLSHNLLTDLSALDNISGNLEWLNVSYNRLKSIPNVSKCTKLKALLINDNQLADVEGLNRMPSLEQIDASSNLLRDHTCLEPLSNLIRIEKLQLQGNPMAFKRGHRLLTINHLNPLVLFSGKLQIDGHLLSPIEQSHFYSREYNGPANVLNSELGGSCLNSFSPSNAEGHATSDCQNRQVMQSRTVKVGAPTGTRPVKIREASIANEEDNYSNGCKESAALPRTEVHLETKRNIESLRKNVGVENWLHEGGGQKVLNILGIPVKASVPPIPLDSVAMSSSPAVVEPSLDQVVLQSDGDVQPSCDKAEEVQVGAEDGGVIRSDDAATEEEDGNDVAALKEQEEKEKGVELGVFVVQKGKVGQSLPMDDFLLRVTDRLLIECNVENGMELARRTLSNLVGVSQENASGDGSSRKSIRFTFRDNYHMEALSYFMEDEESKELLQLIGQMLEMKYLNSKEHTIQLICLRCSTNFVHSSSPSNNSCFRNGVSEDNMEKDLDSAPKCPKCSSLAVMQNIVEEVSNLLQPSVISQKQDDSTLSSKNVALQHSELKDSIAQWAEMNSISEVPTGSEGVDHGLHLHILLNILPDGHGKEYDIQNVLIFQGNTGDAFCGHIVISGDCVYILKDADSHKEGRRLSDDEQSAPVLVEQHYMQSCLSVIKIHSGYLMKFGPETASSLWIFPRQHKKMEGVMEALCFTLKDKQLLLDEDQMIKENSKLSEIMWCVPAAAITCLPLESAVVDDAQHGIIVLTSSVIFFVNHKDIEIYFSNSEYTPTYERNIADLVSLNHATIAVHQVNGITLHFSSEEHDDRCVLWPWGDEVLLDFLHHLRKPWEDIFSVPFETILARTAGEEN